MPGRSPAAHMTTLLDAAHALALVHMKQIRLVAVLTVEPLTARARPQYLASPLCATGGRIRLYTMSFSTVRHQIIPLVPTIHCVSAKFFWSPFRKIGLVRVRVKSSVETDSTLIKKKLLF